MIKYLLALAVFLFLHSITCEAGMFQNFDNFPVTANESLPVSSLDGRWVYSDPTSNPNTWISAYGGSGWYNSTDTYDGGIYTYFRNYICPGGTGGDHMGYPTYGYLDIATGHTGNALRWTTTGGENNIDQVHGTELYAKDSYLALGGQSTISTDGLKVGHPYIYFQNTSISPNFSTFPQMVGVNRLGMYVYIPGGLLVTNSNSTYGSPVNTINIGPYNDVGGHWYHRYYNQGGGWVHVMVDGHPQWNNAWGNAGVAPLGSGAVNDYDTDYFSSMYRFYITFWPYSGIDIPPYYCMIDEMETWMETEPQNNETINSPAVGWYPGRNVFEISFNDKYLNVSHCNSTYEVRYSFAPITNANFSSCNTAVILADARFNKLLGSNVGIIKKQWPYYEGVWAPLQLQTDDHSSLTSGSHVYFAIKDVSQNPLDLSQVNSTYNYGRPYATYPDVYDYTGDSAALPFVKLIDYVISSVEIPPTYDAPTITAPADFNTVNSSAEITGPYTKDADLTVSTVTWTLGVNSGFCVAILGTYTGTVTGLVNGANSVEIEITDSNGGMDSDTTVVTRTVPPSGNFIYTGSMSGGSYR